MPVENADQLRLNSVYAAAGSLSYEICCYMYFLNTARAHSKGPKVFTTITVATLPYIITEADVRLLNHADVIGAVADGGSGWILRTGLDEAHNLSRHINTAA